MGRPLKVSQSECLERGEAAIRRLGFETIERSRYSRFSVESDYTVSVRCISEKRVVLFLAAGPERTCALELQVGVHRNYLDK